MSDASLHLPVEFELSEGVHLLAARLLQDCGLRPGTMCDEGGLPVASISAEGFASLLMLRLWAAWARERQEWRPLRNPVHTGAEPVWATEPLGMLLEKACGWCGAPGVLLSSLVAVGVLIVERREGVSGLRLPPFEDVNEHLLPGYKSIQKRGGDMTALRKTLKKADAVVPQTQQLLMGTNLFGRPGMSEADERAAIGLICRMRAACELPMLNPGEYRGQHEMMKAALKRTQRSTEDEIIAVLGYLREHADNPKVSKDCALILRDFDSLLRLALPV